MISIADQVEFDLGSPLPAPFDDWFEAVLGPADECHDSDADSSDDDGDDGDDDDGDDDGADDGEWAEEDVGPSKAGRKRASLSLEGERMPKRAR